MHRLLNCGLISSLFCVFLHFFVFRSPIGQTEGSLVQLAAISLPWRKKARLPIRGQASFQAPKEGGNLLRLRGLPIFFLARPPPSLLEAALPLSACLYFFSVFARR